MPNGLATVRNSKGAIAKMPFTLSSVISGYDNINAIPSTANRPMFDSGTNILSWIGPIGGGASTSHDTAQTKTLTPSSGFSTSTNNQIIQDICIGDGDGSITVNHTGVIIRRCSLQAIAIGLHTLNGSEINLLIEDCELNGPLDDVDGGMNGITVRRCHFHHTENNITKWMQNIDVLDTLFNDVEGADADQIEIYAKSSTEPSENINIDHCTFTGPTRGGDFYNSGVNLSNWPDGSISNVTINRCYFISTGNNVINDDDRFSSGTVQFSVTNCGFYNVGTYHLNELHNVGSGIIENSGNFDMATATSTSGSLVNGTGSI